MDPDPDPGGPKTCGSGRSGFGSGSATLLEKVTVLSLPVQRYPEEAGQGPAAGNGDAGRALHDEEGAAGDQQAGPGARQGQGDRGHRHRQHRLR